MAFFFFFLLTLFIPSSSEWVAFPSSSEIWAEWSKVGVGQEKPGGSAHILAVNFAVLPSLCDTTSLSSFQFVPSQASIHCLSHQLYAVCQHPWKVYILCFRKLIFLWLAIIFSPIWMTKQRSRKWVLSLHRKEVNFGTSFSLAVFSKTTKVAFTEWGPRSVGGMNITARNEGHVQRYGMC